MIVEYYMTTDLVTIEPETKIYDAVELMNQHHIHRLPVLKNGKLVGLITEGTIQSAMPSKATSLSVYEVNYLLNKTTVAETMIKEVVTIGPTALLEDAIKRMRENNVGVLPVCDGEKLVGIITNNDIFDAFLEITGYNQEGLRVTIDIAEDHQGVLARLTALFAENHMNIVQIVVFRHDGQPTIVVQLTDAEEEKVRSVLSANDFVVKAVVETTKED